MWAPGIGDVIILITLAHDILKTFRSSDAKTDFHSIVNFIDSLHITLAKLEATLQAIAESIQSVEHNVSSEPLSAEGQGEVPLPQQQSPSNGEVNPDGLSIHSGDADPPPPGIGEGMDTKINNNAPWTLEELKSIESLIENNMKPTIGRFLERINPFTGAFLDRTQKASSVPSKFTFASLASMDRESFWIQTTNLRLRIKEYWKKMKWTASMDEEAKHFKQSISCSLLLVEVTWSQLTHSKSSQEFSEKFEQLHDTLLDMQKHINNRFDEREQTIIQALENRVSELLEPILSVSQDIHAKVERAQETAEGHDMAAEGHRQAFEIDQKLALILQHFRDSKENSDSDRPTSILESVSAIMAASKATEASNHEDINHQSASGDDVSLEDLADSQTTLPVTTYPGTSMKAPTVANESDLIYLNQPKLKVFSREIIHETAMEDCCPACEADSTLEYLDLAIRPDHDDSNSSFHSDDLSDVDSLDLFPDNTSVKSGEYGHSLGGDAGYEEGNSQYRGAMEQGSDNSADGGSQDGGVMEQGNDNSADGGSQGGGVMEQGNDNSADQGSGDGGIMGQGQTESWEERASRINRAGTIFAASCVAAVIMSPRTAVIPLASVVGNWTYVLGTLNGWW